LAEPVERTPVWAMRQAGRWDPEFQRLRGDRDFYAFSENPELSAAASLCPSRFGVDAIILFYDITTLAIAMGQQFTLVPQRGPVPHRPIGSLADVERLAAHPDPEQYKHVLETLRIVRAELRDALPTLVFAGAPFTMATYQIGTGKDLDATRSFIRDQPEVWRALLARTATATGDFLKVLIESGADAFQLFDSWAGNLSAAEFREHALVWHEQVFESVDGISILFVKDCPHLDLMAQSRAKVISLGTIHDLAAARRAYPNLVFQGNVDHQLLVRGEPGDVRRAVLACLEAGGGRQHILNLDHGMDPRAKPEAFAAFVDAAKSRSSGK
jgi:uroporphyrinogen decarboxylase